MNKSKNSIDEKKPPLFPSWNGWYIFVLLILALLVGIFYLITKIFQ